MLEGSSDEGRRETTSDREIVISRVFDAPRERVFEAWTHPDHIAKWWGPRGFRTTTESFEFRPGGAWCHTMVGPDGTRYLNRLVYDEITQPERIVYSHHGGIDGVIAQFQATIAFTARGEKTELTMRQVYRSARERDAVIEKYGAVEGGKQTLARLEEHLAEEALAAAATSTLKLELSRVFNAPRETVFEAWSKPEHLSSWFAPRPLTVPRCELDFRAGGAFRLVMRSPDGMEFPMEATFREVVAPEKIVFAGVIHGGNAVVTTLTFAEEGKDGKQTRLDVVQTFAFASDATRGARQGWTLTLEQLGRVAEGAPDEKKTKC